MPLEFKIGRLRYTWKGQWSTGSFYNRDAVIQYEGKCFVCLEPHTSSATDFYDDLYYITPGGANQPRWDLMVDGRAWKQDWQPNTAYSIGNIVKYGGIVYVCTVAHTSGAEQIDQANWDYYTKFDNWNSNWEIDTVYGEGDIVKYGGIVYRCIENHKSANNLDDGLELDQLKWEILNAGIDYKNDWADGTRYKVNDIVKNGSDAYICTAGHIADTLFDPTKFSLWLPGAEYYNTWSSVEIYQPGDIVKYGGYSYFSLTINNTNNIPSSSALEWELLTKGFDVRDDWDGSAYEVGDLVRRGGQLFVAIIDNAGQDPTAISIDATYAATGSLGTTVKVDSTTGIVPGMILIGDGFNLGQTVVSVADATTVITDRGPDGVLQDMQMLSFVGVNYTYWKLVVPSILWLGFWESERLYVIGETVLWQNGTYRCIQTIPNSTSAVRPDLDITNTYWTPLSLHDRFNAGSTQGDIVTRNSNETNIPLAIGTDDYVLQVNVDMPNWAKIQTANDVYYVATDGVDDVDRGDTVDKPWQSIKYACETIEKGSLLQNANTLLVNNKDFLVEEMYQWMLYQKTNSIAPFSPTSVFDEFSTKRDAKLLIDALSYDITRGSNSRIVYATEAYFADGSDTTFRSEETDAAQPYIVASLNYLLSIVLNAINNQEPSDNYQAINGVDEGERYIQFIDQGISSELTAATEITSLLSITISAIENVDKSSLPLPNYGITSTIVVKTGTYSETLPIVVPDNTAIIGDELRSTVIQPATRVSTFATNVYADTDEIKVHSVKGMAVNMPIQLKAPSINDQFSNITEATTYYIKSIDVDTNRITISETVDGDTYDLDDNSSGLMTVYAGDCLKDMFYMRNATGLRNCTLVGLCGFLSDLNEFATRRPTGGAYTSLDPGTGPDDTRAWIMRRSPYVQNVTNFGTGCAGMKIDGLLHNGGNKSMVANDYTQIVSDGIGIWCTGPASLTECVSVFTYYNYAGYFAEDGGRIRATNGNSSYGTYGVIAEGYDDTEVPISGQINNRSSQVQASVQSAFGTSAELLSMQYDNAGSNYFEETTNLLAYSNHLDEPVWQQDGNLIVQQNNSAPNGEPIAWTLTATTSSSDSSYLYQTITIPKAGFEYTGLSSLNVSGSGTNSTFDITVGADSYSAIVNDGGTGYVVGNVLRILGSQLGGIDGTNDCFLEVTSLTGSAVLAVTVTGTVPQGSAQKYTLSIYAKEGTSNSFDMSAIFSGYSDCTANANFNFSSETFTTFIAGSLNGNGTITTGKLDLPNGWWRIWITVYDYNALNDSLEFRIYPRGRTGNAGYTRYYGPQVQIATSPTFYLDTRSDKYSAKADFYITGAGTDAELVGDEIRSGSVFQTRLTDEGVGTGGRGYMIASNNAQAGDYRSVVLSGSDTAIESEYIRMRCFLQSGTGAGQYGYIASYDDAITKTAIILKESFVPLNVVSTDNATGELSIAGSTTDTLFIDQEIQFIPTYYNTELQEISTAFLKVEATLGGVDNIITVSSTAKLLANMTIKFRGNIYGGLTESYTYYIKEVVNGTQFSVSTEPFGNQQNLVDGYDDPQSDPMEVIFPSYDNFIKVASTNNMLVNMPITFTGTSIGELDVGTTYYISDIIDAEKLTISETLNSFTATNTQASTNYVTTTTTATLSSLNPIVFSGVTFGNIVAKTKYYINKIASATEFTITDTIIETTATATESVSNLITCSDTTGFIPNNPIKFTGLSFGGIVNETIYYILAVNDGTTFTISATPGGSALILSDGAGEIGVSTSGNDFVLTTAAGSMISETTTQRESLSFGQGSMSATFSTKVFGDVVRGTSYFVTSKPSASTFTVSTTLGGANITLESDTGSMNVGAVGWDHINPGTPIVSALDNSTVYYVEPRVKYSEPTFNQTATTLPTLSQGVEWASFKYGNGVFIGIPSLYATGAKSTDGNTWTPITLPKTTSWIDIAYGNQYWVAISSEVSLDASPNIAGYSNSNGSGWRISTLPAASLWRHLVYGNGKFVSIANNNTHVIRGETGTNVSGSGVGASFNVTNTGGIYTVQLYTSGTGYQVGNVIRIPGTSLFGTSPTNDLDITVATLTTDPLAPDPTAIESVTISGTGTSITVSGYSTTGGSSWIAGGALPPAAYSGITYGAGTFVCVSSGSYYFGLSGSNISSAGNSALFDVETNGVNYTVTIQSGGTGYGIGDTIGIPGTSVGGTSPENDIVITVDVLDSSPGGDPTAISQVSATGVAVSRTAAYSADGISWIETALPTTAAWSDVKFGNGLFVAVSATDSKAAYSRDGINWSLSNIEITPITSLEYGQGVFLGISNTSGTAWTTEDGQNWKERLINNDGYSALAFGYDDNGNGIFITGAGQDTGSYISAGCQTKGRVTIASSRITGVNLWEPGSGYETAPTVEFIDPNQTISASYLNRISNGTLGNPSFFNRGQNYNTNSTRILINGGGYADTFQVGLTIIVKNLTKLPAPGDNLIIDGVDQVYKVTSAETVYGTVAPNIQANVQIAPEMSVANSPAHEAAITIRTQYSQARLSNHDFLNVGYGNAIQSNYPGVPEDTVLSPQDQAVEVNFGRVFYSSTDQDGNFKVGDLFGVEQATGIVTLSASQFGLQGLETLSLGGIAVGNASVVIRQFSTDETMIANSNEIIPTQRAIKAYLEARLSQGGSNTFTGQLIAGTVLVGGPNKISSTIPEGVAGAVVNMPNMVRVFGEFAGWDGDGMALQYFIKCGSRR